jgi:hypothetical protein
MPTQSLVDTYNRFVLISLLRKCIDTRLNYLLSESNLVLTDTELQIHTTNKVVDHFIFKRIKHLDRVVNRCLGVTPVLYSRNGRYSLSHL